MVVVVLVGLVVSGLCGNATAVEVSGAWTTENNLCYISRLDISSMFVSFSTGFNNTGRY